MYAITANNLVKKLEGMGLEVVRLWDKVADMLHHEIIEICNAQYIDLLVTSNERILTPKEEWINYLIPSRTRIWITNKKSTEDNEQIAKMIQTRAYTKRRYKTIEGE